MSPRSVPSPSARQGHRPVVAALAACAALALLSGCSSARLVRVQPWERGALAGYSMRADRDPLAGAMGEHIYFSREASSGGRGVGGAGCGCN